MRTTDQCPLSVQLQKVHDVIGEHGHAILGRVFQLLVILLTTPSDFGNVENLEVTTPQTEGNLVGYTLVYQDRNTIIRHKDAVALVAECVTERLLMAGAVLYHQRRVRICIRQRLQDFGA